MVDNNRPSNAGHILPSSSVNNIVKEGANDNNDDDKQQGIKDRNSVGE